MNKVFLAFVVIISTLLVSCGTPTPPPEPVIVQYTAAARPWLSEIESCSEGMVIAAELRSQDFIDLDVAHLALSLGGTPVSDQAYKIDDVETFIVVNEDNPVRDLSQSQAEALFGGIIQNWSTISGEDEEINLWVYPSDDDLFRSVSAAFSGLPISPSAHLAADEAAMLIAVQEDPYALGMLTEHMSESGVRRVYRIAEIPVLILLPEDPSLEALSVLSCLTE
jgi:hypothetical protein